MAGPYTKSRLLYIEKESESNGIYSINREYDDKMLRRSIEMFVWLNDVDGLWWWPAINVCVCLVSILCVYFHLALHFYSYSSSLLFSTSLTIYYTTHLFDAQHRPFPFSNTSFHFSSIRPLFLIHPFLTAPFHLKDKHHMWHFSSSDDDFMFCYCFSFMSLHFYSKNFTSLLPSFQRIASQTRNNHFSWEFVCCWLNNIYAMRLQIEIHFDIAICYEFCSYNVRNAKIKCIDIFVDRVFIWFAGFSVGVNVWKAISRSIWTIQFRWVFR